MATSKKRLAAEYAAAIEFEFLPPKPVSEGVPDISLFEFFCEAWRILEPDTPLLSNWHQELICEYLELVSVGEITRLVINIPPRYSKSLLATVCYPCWEWTFKPATRWVFASYSGSLSTDHSIARRYLIKSDWYQARWGDRFALAGDQDLKTQFSNNHRGTMVATSTGGTVTGKGGKLLIDDPISPKQAMSDAMRAAANQAFDLTLSSRLNDKKRDPIVLIMQRLHELDMTGHLLAKGGYTLLKLSNPAEQEESIVFPKTKRVIHRKAGDLLHPEREGETEIEQRRIELGSFGFASQYLQNPSPTGGGIFKIEDWVIYTDLPQIGRWLISADCTFKKSATADNVAIGAIGQQFNVKKIQRSTINEYGREVIEEVWLHNYYLLSCWAKQAGIVETQTAILAMRDRFPQCAITLVEDKANGSAVLEQLSSNMIGLTPFNPGSDSKTSRAWSIQPIHERNALHLPASAEGAEVIRALGKTSITLGEYWGLYPPQQRSNADEAPVDDWAKAVINEFTQFPTGAHDDRVDMVDQALIYCEANPPPRPIKKTGLKIY